MWRSTRTAQNWSHLRCGPLKRVDLCCNMHSIGIPGKFRIKNTCCVHLTSTVLLLDTIFTSGTASCLLCIYYNEGIQYFLQTFPLIPNVDKLVLHALTLVFSTHNSSRLLLGWRCYIEFGYCISLP